MANRIFPQLSLGSSVQYPFSKAIQRRTIVNVLQDGSIVSLPDSAASKTRWELQYSGLNETDVLSIRSHFDSCCGPLLPFTFIDPTGNSFGWSSDLTNRVWNRSAYVKVEGGNPDPTGANNAFSLVNNGQNTEEFCQVVQIPCNYVSCFSVYVSSPSEESLVVVRRGASAVDETTLLVKNGWTRIETTNQMNDGGQALTAGLKLASGQALSVFGPQIEAQPKSSCYRPTAIQSAVYLNCFWATDELLISADAPHSYSTIVSLETNA